MSKHRNKHHERAAKAKGERMAELRLRSLQGHTRAIEPILVTTHGRYCPALDVDAIDRACDCL